MWACPPVIKFRCAHDRSPRGLLAMAEQCPNCARARPAFTRCPTCGAVRSAQGSRPKKLTHAASSTSNPRMGTKTPPYEKLAADLTTKELRHELVKKRGNAARKTALKQEFQKRKGAGPGQSAISAPSLAPHELSDKELRTELRRDGLPSWRLKALRAEQRRRAKKRTSKRKTRNPESLPVHQLTERELQAEIKRSGKSRKRAAQVKREQINRLSGLNHVRVVSGGSPGLGTRNGKR